MPIKASPQSEWMAKGKWLPTLRHHSVSAKVYLPTRPWLFRLSLTSFAEWFWSQTEQQPNGCRAWQPDDWLVTLEEGWSETPERIAWCITNRDEPGDGLVLFRNCPNDRCVSPGHLFSVGELVDLYSRVRRVETGCWIWQGSKTHDGYGRYFVEGREVRAHVYAWEYDWGLLPPGRFVCH